MSKIRPRMCVLSTTPLVIHFFFRPHLVELSRFFEITVAFNSRSDTYLPPLSLPVKEVHISVERKISPWRDLLALFSVSQFLRRGGFDIVVSVVPKAGLLGMVAAFVMRVPVRVHIFQGEVWASKRGPMRWLLRFMDSLTARLATHVLTVSESEKDFLEQQRVAPLGKAEVLGAGSICGVDTGRFKPDPNTRSELRRKLGVPDDGTLCIFLGRLTADKGVLDLIRAFSICATDRPNLWLLIVGPDEEGLWERLSQLIPSSLVNRLLIQGFTQNPERLLAASDFLCLPSYREGFGMVILEAAAVGIPAIGTRIYGITDAIREGDGGKLVPVGDVLALSAAMSQWIDDPQERRRCASSAFARARADFEQRVVVDRYVQYLTRAVRGD